MQTRCYLGYETEGEIRYIYVHLEGFPQKPGVGHLLLEHYDRDKVIEVIEHGDCNYLGKRIEDTSFYMRNSHPRITKKNIWKGDSFIQFFYYVDTEGKIWYRANKDKVGEYKDLRTYKLE
jgi:hypothetical protein